MRFAIFLPNVGEFYDPKLLVELAVAAELEGWDGVFIWDELSWSFDDDPSPVSDPWIAMAAIAQETERVRFGPMVTPLARRRPAKVARETVTLDRLSGGRFVLGVGLGEPDDQFEDFGEDADPKVRASKLDESLDLLARFWSGEQVNHSGTNFQVKDAVFLPRPVQEPRIPVWVGGFWPNKPPARRAARWDGMFPASPEYPGGFLSPDDMANAAAYVGQHRDPGAGPFDMVSMGTLDGRRPACSPAMMREYRDAGVTWWVSQADEVSELRRLIANGPPQL